MTDSIMRADPLKVLNPSTEETIGEIPNHREAEVDLAATAAADALDAWAAHPNRAGVIGDCARELQSNAMRLAKLLTREQGKPLRESIEELMGAVQWIRSLAVLESPPAQERTISGATVLVERRPIGVLAAILPWNYPVILATWKLAPGLLAGNSVILKPSPFTPLATAELVELFNKHLPPGVLQVLTGDDETGRLLAGHPHTAHISLTGSIAAGRAVGAQSGHALKSATLELGGNDPAIVCRDADVESAASAIAACAFKNCGQTCTAIKRVYVHRSIIDNFTGALVTIANGIVVGDGLERTTQMGPMNNKPQLERVRALVRSALENGGDLRCGGSEPPAARGYFHAPTVITGLSDNHPLVQEEQSGPVLPLLAFDHPDEAVERANQTDYGLGGSVWSQDSTQAAEVAARLDCGTVWLNRHGVLDPTLPFGGYKASGLGYVDGIESYTRPRVTFVGD